MVPLIMIRRGLPRPSLPTSSAGVDNGAPPAGCGCSPAVCVSGSYAPNGDPSSPGGTGAPSPAVTPSVPAVCGSSKYSPKGLFPSSGIHDVPKLLGDALLEVLLDCEMKLIQQASD